MKFEKPSRIQAETLPMILLPPHSNLIAQAHNGSGKTTCFVLGMLSRVDPAVRSPQALCICPTRELVVQNVQVPSPSTNFGFGMDVLSAAECHRGERRRTLR
jgi:ATP-dependent RNA helicase DDX19/DBP5